MKSVTRPLVGLPLLAALVLALGACGESATEPTGELEPQFNTVSGGWVKLWKFGPYGTTATFEISATGGTLPLGSTVTLEACPYGDIECYNPVIVWQAGGSDIEEITITEVGFTGDVALERINVLTDLDGFWDIWWPDNPTVTVRASDSYKALVRFKNVGTPDDGSAGCTPGFWKQPQHFEYWTEPYTPSTLFGAVFSDVFPTLSLLDVLELEGGQENALGRHSVAALLNAASPNVDYGMSAAEVIAAFNAAVAEGGDAIEDQKDIFEGYNERGCTAKD